MAAFRYPRTSQPQSPVGVDYSGLGKGVRMLLTQQGGRVVDIANPGVIWTPNGNASTKPTLKGVAATFDGVDDYFSASGYPNIVGAKGTFFMWIPRIGALDSNGTVWFGTNTGSASWFQNTTNTAYCFGSGSFTAGTVSNVASTSNTSLVFTANTAVNTQRYFRNGISEGTVNATTPTAFAAGSKNFNFGRYIGGTTWDADADIVIAGFTTEVWGVAQAKAFHENPWQLFSSQARQIFVPSTGGGVNYSLLCDAGAFTLAGQDATLTYTAGTANYTLACDAGAYVLAGQDAALTYTPGSASVAYSLLCDGGAYALAGQDATLTYVSNAPVAYSLLCDAGAYSISGQEAALTFSGQRATPSNEVELRSPKRWYVKREKQILVFNSASEADAFIDAEQTANEAIEKAQKTSRRARKRLKDRVFKVAGVAPVQTIEIDRLGEMVGRFNVPVNLPEILAQQDYAHVLRILEAVMMLQDDEDVELLLLG